MQRADEASMSIGKVGRVFWYFLEGYRKSFVFWSLLVVLLSFYQLVPPLIVGIIVDFFTKYIPGESLHFFYFWVGVLGISFAVVSLLRLTARNKVGNIQAEITYNVKVMGFERLLDYSLTWHDKENTGNKIQRILNGSQALNRLTRLMGQTGIKTFTAIIGIIIVFLFLSPMFVLFAVIYLTAFLSIHSYFYSKAREVTDAYNKAQEQASGSYYEGLTNVLTIKTLGAKDSFKHSIHKTEEATKQYNYALRRIGITKWKAFQLCNASAMTIFLLMVGSGIVGGTITIGEIFVFYSYLMRLVEAASDSTDVIDEYIEYQSAIARMMPIYWNSETAASEGHKQFPSDWKTLAIRDGYLRYGKSDTTYALEGITLVIKKNEKIGIVGHSGSGKSTLAKVLLGLYPLDKGTFAIGETNYYDIRHVEVTRHIATVLQESEMFNMSLRDNITLMRNVPDALLEKAVEIAQLNDLINKLPDGLDTLIGEKGYKVSGGERQRIGIARAICKDPEILVLDEATSSLDSRTEMHIQEALEKELQQKTMIIIAHRVSTLKNADRIIVFEKGKIVEEGTYDSLMHDKTSQFYRVYSSQQKYSVKSH